MAVLDRAFWLLAELIIAQLTNNQCRRPFRAGDFLVGAPGALPRSITFGPFGTAGRDEVVRLERGFWGGAGRRISCAGRAVILAGVQSLRRAGLVGGTPYGVLCYCIGDRGCREWLAVPPASHRSSLRDGLGWGDLRQAFGALVWWGPSGSSAQPVACSEGCWQAHSVRKGYHVAPFQGLVFFVVGYLGRCPSLSHVAPLGQVDDAVGVEVGRCPGV